MFEPQFFEEWLREKKNMSETTIAYYISVATRFLKEYDNVNLENINNFIIQNAIKKRQTPVYSIMKAFVQYSEKDASQRNNMIENMIRPPVHDTPKRERAYLEEEDIVKIINNMRNEKHKIIAMLQDLTGVRAGDVMRIQRGNIIPEIYDNTNVLKIVIYGKGNKRNVIYVHDDIGQQLILHYIIKNRHSDQYYFMEQRGRSGILDIDSSKNYHTNYIAYFRDLKQSMARSGIEHKSFATHDYRRCYARRVWNKFKDLHVLQELLNHQNPATTMRYLKHSGLQNIDYHKQMQG